MRGAAGDRDPGDGGMIVAEAPARQAGPLAEKLGEWNVDLCQRLPTQLTRFLRSRDPLYESQNPPRDGLVRVIVDIQGAVAAKLQIAADKLRADVPGATAGDLHRAHWRHRRSP